MCNLCLYKEQGYFLDLLAKTTHPVELEVNEASESQDIFDSITYSKGAAMLHQLESLMGNENFFNGVREYLEKFSWSNAESKDLFGYMKNEVEVDMDRWFKEWLQCAGVNVVWSEITDEKSITVY